MTSDCKYFGQQQHLHQTFRYFTYVLLECTVDMTPVGSTPEYHLRPLRDCMYSVEQRRRVVPFGYKFVIQITIMYEESSGHSVTKSVQFTGRQFLIRDTPQRSYVKAKQLREKDSILVKRTDNRIISAVVTSVLRFGHYVPVAELWIRDREMFSVDEILCVALSKHRKKSKPVISHGIIAYYQENSTIYYLIVRRRHTMAFLDFIRGKYFNNDRFNMCKIYLTQMTREERDMLQKHSFDDLWNVVWGNNIGDRPNQKYIKQYRKCAHRWQQLDLVSLLTEVTISPHPYPEYGWPKGRANREESTIDTALREFIEETGLKDMEMVLDQDTVQDPRKESFIGNNGIQYDHYYTLARIVHAPQIKEQLTPTNLEIGSVEFQTYNDCMRLFRPDDVAKRRLLTDVHLDLMNQAIKQSV